MDGLDGFGWERLVIGWVIDDGGALEVASCVIRAPFYLCARVG